MLERSVIMKILATFALARFATDEYDSVRAPCPFYA